MYAHRIGKGNVQFMIEWNSPVEFIYVVCSFFNFVLESLNHIQLFLKYLVMLNLFNRKLTLEFIIYIQGCIYRDISIFPSLPNVHYTSPSQLSLSLSSYVFVVEFDILTHNHRCHCNPLRPPRQMSSASFYVVYVDSAVFVC